MVILQQQSNHGDGRKDIRKPRLEYDITPAAPVIVAGVFVFIYAQKVKHTSRFDSEGLPGQADAGVVGFPCVPYACL